MKTQGITLRIDGVDYDQWTEASVTRDLKNFSGSFDATFRDPDRSLSTFDYASPPPIFRLRPGQSVKAYADGELVLVGFVKTVNPSIDADEASVSISGEDKAGDLVDCAGMPEGPAEFKNVKLEEAAKRIASPFGLQVRSEIDTGAPFPRYGVDLAEFAHHAIEKGARQRHALVMSDGVGGVVITRSGAGRAPADLVLPGNVKSSEATFSHENRHSKTIVRGQAEKAGQRRDGRQAAYTPAGAPRDLGDRAPGDGSATEREREGTALTGIAEDDEIGRYRPIVHLARTKASRSDVQDEADWRMRTRRAECEEATYGVHGFGVAGRLWRVNELARVSDSFQGIERDMLISRVTYSEGEEGRVTELALSSPEAFGKGKAGKARTNSKGRSKGLGKGLGSLDGTAEAL